MFVKAIFALFVVLSISSAVTAQPGSVRPGGAGVAAGAWPSSGGVNPWIPPWMALQPWYPQWSPCTTIGSSCLDCNTRMVCTKIGGIQRACTDPSKSHCNLGECSETPSEECAPVTTQLDATA